MNRILFTVLCIFGFSCLLKAQVCFTGATHQSWAGGIGGRHGEIFTFEGVMRSSKDSVVALELKVGKSISLRSGQENTEWNVFYSGRDEKTDVTIRVQTFCSEFEAGEKTINLPAVWPERITLVYKTGSRMRSKSMRLLRGDKLSFP